MRLVVLGLSLTSAWGNGHATTYRALLRELARRGHDVLFLERDVPWYARHRDLHSASYCRVALYQSCDELFLSFEREVAEADAVILGSYVPDGALVARWLTGTAGGVRAFYDIDTPVTLAGIASGDCDYLDADVIGAFDLYLSFAGGSVLDRLAAEYGVKRPLPLYCSVDPERYRPVPARVRWDLGYLGTYSVDRQGVLEELLLAPARRHRAGRFVVGGPQYPADTCWPSNVMRIEHVPPNDHVDFYGAQRFTLNVTRSDMVHAGYSPSVRLFEAAACGVPIISDYWAGLETFFDPGEEILVAGSAEESYHYLTAFSEEVRREIGVRARERVLAEHTSAHRAAQLESYLVS